MINSGYILPILILSIFIMAFIKKVNAYDAFLKGVKEGLLLFIDVYPAFLAMMCAITLLRESGVMNVITNFFENFTTTVPSEIWPMIFFRPISGSASLAVMIDIFKTSGVDSLAGIMASIIQGSTDTTLYVITLYFSSVGIKKIGNSLKIGLLADIAGISCAILMTLLFFH